MKRTRKEAAFDINNLEIIKHRLMIYRKISNVSYIQSKSPSVIHLIFTFIPQPSFVLSLAVKEHPHFGKHRKYLKIAK
jgi:hypothetical protein